jgi:hypothetical protein
MLMYIPKQFENQVITVPVWTITPERMCIRVYNHDKANTTYFETDPIINGKQNFTVKIPKSPDLLVLELYNDNVGNVQFDKTFKVGKIRVDELVPNITALGIMNKTARDFVMFSDDFAEDAGELPAQNNVYTSRDGRFTIHYKYVIRDDKGNELTTPARVNSDSKVMEIASKYYRNYTVAGRKFINLHEFAHVFANNNPSDELEADKNALFIGLAIGLPKIEAFNVFLKVFNNSPSDLNVERTKQLRNYITNFNKMMAGAVFQ